MVETEKFIPSRSRICAAVFRVAKFHHGLGEVAVRGPTDRTATFPLGEGGGMGMRSERGLCRQYALQSPPKTLRGAFQSAGTTSVASH